MGKYFLKFLLVFAVIIFTIPTAIAQSPTSKTKFYNFEDLLIEGKVKKPQVLYTDARQKVKFGKLLELKKSFLRKTLDSKKDPALR